MTSDLRRILALPVDNRVGEDLVEKWTQKTRLPGGSWRLFSHQALALEYAEASRDNGLLLPMTVGAGKTLTAMLLPEAMGIPPERTLVLCPAPLVSEAAREAEIYREHFRIPSGIHYMSYNTISTDPEAIERLAPLLIVADEAHALKNPKAARTRRFIRYVKEHLATIRFVAMSATFSTASINEYALLARVALKEFSPIPHAWPTVQEWARCLDTNNRVPPTKDDWAKLMPLVDAFLTPEERDSMGVRDAAREAFGRRLQSTPGVVVTQGDSCDKPLVVQAYKPETPAIIREALEEARGTYCLPNGDIIDSPMDLAAKAKQLALGFYYYWDWPNGEPDMDWIYARREFNREVHRFLGRKGFDTPMLIERGLAAGQIKFGPLVAAWREWLTQADKPEPPTAVEWLTDELLQSALLHVSGNTLIWYSHLAVADRLAALGVPTFYGEQRPIGGGIAAVSSYAHATGLNLQHEWDRNLVLTPMANGGKWQQLIGRTHRNGQQSDHVLVEYMAHERELSLAFGNALKSARYIEKTQRLEQKLNNYVDYPLTGGT